MNLSPQQRIPFQFSLEQQAVIEAARQQVLAHGPRGQALDFEFTVAAQYRVHCQRQSSQPAAARPTAQAA